MALTNTNHINFRGDARQALEFYASVFDGELTVVTFGDVHSAERPEETDQVMWGQVKASNGFRIMAFDMPASRDFDRGTMSFYEAIEAGSLDEAKAVWAKLSEGGTIVTEFGPQPWASAYGMLTDRFGVTWWISVDSVVTGG